MADKTYPVILPEGEGEGQSDAWVWADYLADDELENPPPLIQDIAADYFGWKKTGWLGKSKPKGA